MNITCTNIDCPERTGGKCQGENLELTEDELTELFYMARKQLAENSIDLDPDQARILEDNFWDLLMT